jgi:lysophospholipase L1-like esterase
MKGFGMIQRIRTAVAMLLAAFALAGAAPAAIRTEIAVRDGEKIAFLGDSITQGGMGTTGYVSLVIHGLKSSGVNAAAIGAGISGHKSNDMLARLQRDVIDKKPDWMTLSCGVNDVWHGAKGVPLDAYQQNITQIVEKVQAAGIKVMILTSTMIGENAADANNQKLEPYNDFLRKLANEKKCLLADLNADMHRELDEKEKESRKRGNLLTSDGVHMNPHGNMMMAAGVLRGFGLDDAQRAKAREAWLDIPGGATLAPQLKFTLRQLANLEVAAAKQGKTVQALLQAALEKEVSSLLEK